MVRKRSGGAGSPPRADSRPWDVLEACYLGGASRYDRLPAPGRAAVAFAGRSNVGKSSLLNALAGRRALARTSKRPGATRAVHVFRLRLRLGAEVDFVDLPGYGYAARSKSERASWGPLVDRVLGERPGLRAVAVLLDARRGPEREERDLLQLLHRVGRRPLVVATKLDRLAPSRRESTVASLGRVLGVPVHGVGSPRRMGIDALWRALLDALDVMEAG